MLRADEGGEVLFKLGHIRPEAERAVVQGPRNDGVEFLAERPQLCDEVEIGNFVSHGFFWFYHQFEQSYSSRADFTIK
jgi:hypothetical protein